LIPQDAARNADAVARQADDALDVCGWRPALVAGILEDGNGRPLWARPNIRPGKKPSEREGMLAVAVVETTVVADVQGRDHRAQSGMLNGSMAKSALPVIKTQYSDHCPMVSPAASLSVASDAQPRPSSPRTSLQEPRV
jgi:hypothetical protein